MTYCEYSDNELDPVFSPLLTLNKFQYIQFAACRADKQDRGNCQYWKNSGFCHRSSKYYGYSFNSLQQKIYSYGKNFVAVKKNLDLRILRPQRRIIILCRRIMILETRILVLPPRLIILLRRNSFCLVLFGRILFLFERQKVLLRRISVLKDLLRRILVLSPRLRILFRRN